MTKQQRKLQLALTLNKAANRLQADIARGAEYRKSNPDLWDGGPFGLRVVTYSREYQFKSVSKIREMIRKVLR